MAKIDPLPVVDRRDFIIDAHVGAVKTLHVGCADAPFTAERLGIGGLLHFQMLSASTSTELVGVDLDESALKLLRDVKPSCRLERLDIEREVMPESFDLIVLGEVLEHLLNPGQALAGMASMLSPEGRIVVTVPNALALKSAIRSLVGREVVHPDHVAYYSPMVIRRLASACSLEVSWIGQYLSSGSSRATLANRALGLLAGAAGRPIGDGLVCVMRRSPSSAEVPRGTG